VIVAQAASAAHALAAAGAGHTSPSGPAFTVLLLAHVAAALVGMAALVVAAASASRLARAPAGARPAALGAYYAPGPNRAGRALWAVPVLGALLIADSGGRDGWGDAWVLAGLGLWALAAGVAELWVWPAEQRIRRSLAPGPEEPHGHRPDGAPTADRAAEPPADASRALAPGELARLCTRVVAGSLFGLAVLVVAVVVMVARP
jgi:hypothetical protein